MARTIGYFSLLAACIVLSGTMKAMPLEGGFLVRVNLNVLSPVSEVCSVSAIRTCIHHCIGNQRQQQ